MKPKHVSAKFDILLKLQRDHRGCYRSECAKYSGIDSITNSPKYPESNGLAERLVQAVGEVQTLSSLVICRATPLESGASRADVWRNIRMGKVWISLLEYW